MIFHRAWRAFLRFAFQLFYNPFAFTYDVVSALVSRGHWRDWTRAAIPRIAGARVLELPCGAGNLTLDLLAAGYSPIGVDLSPAMLRITRGKLNRVRLPSRLIRARAEALPFARASFDSLVMTFPPGFAYDPVALAEMYRVLDDDGRLIWVDGGRLLPRDAWDRALDAALNAVSAPSSVNAVLDVLKQVGFEPQLETVQDEASAVLVVTAHKRRDK
ncbi:MAG: methyltransferase domain-containing protein [Chloroflexi bacterium]|nr:methyltransferase domain-containing protein [Chloroflexota bacterium]